MPAQTPDQVHPLFEQAFNDRDLDALMALYEPDCVFVVQPGQTVSGVDQIREALTGFLATGGTMRVTALGSVAGPDIAIVYQRWALEGNEPDGQPLNMGGLISDVVRRGSDGAWRFVIDNPFAGAFIATD
jgi:uncharacterized protein (TIGR02246 family)